MTMRGHSIEHSRQRNSAAAYSPKPEITDCKPADLEFPGMAAAQDKIADDEPADRESAEREKAACESPCGDREKGKRTPTLANGFRRRPDGAFLPVFVVQFMHRGKVLRRHHGKRTLPRATAKDQGSEKIARTVATSTA